MKYAFILVLIGIFLVVFGNHTHVDDTSTFGYSIVFLGACWVVMEKLKRD